MLYHTSPIQITQINADGLFGEFLCFSRNVYTMTAKASYFVYGIEQEDLNIVEACRLAYTDEDEYEKIRDIVDDVAERFEIEKSMALDLIAELRSIHDLWEMGIDTPADTEFWLQAQMCLAAKALGYDGVQGEDEQGGVYFINMFGREAQLIEITQE